jgi:biotin synthase
MDMKRQELYDWLICRDNAKLEELYARAYQVKLSHVGACVYLRGLIELSNTCANNCFYCGIRADNQHVQRYEMGIAEIIKTAELAHDLGYGSVVLQAGERRDAAFIYAIEEVIRGIKAIGNCAIGITLSLGEQTKETYARWFEAGAHRYLLRIETSNPILYSSLHPASIRGNFNHRLVCLNELRSLGYQVGTGVMIGLPGQTIDDLVNDIYFFAEHDIDMVGMGPYIVHTHTPLATRCNDFQPQENFRRALTMIALTRLCLKDVNIASTTALQALHPQGREQGLLAGANIIMPNITPRHYRQHYQLYDDKPCLDEDPTQCSGCLAQRIASLGEKIGYRQWGDSPHFLSKK